MKISRKGWILFISISLLLPILAYAAYRWVDNNLNKLPYYAQNYTVRSIPPYFTVPAYSFLNQDSVMVNNSFTDNKIWVAHYFFTTCPSICPKMMNGMGDVAQAFKNNNDVKLVSFTVDPVKDVPSVLKTYADLRHINASQWQLLTGEKKPLYAFARKGLFIVATDGDGGPGDFIHSEKLVLIDRENHIRGYYDGTEPSDIQLLINDINRLLKE